MRAEACPRAIDAMRLLLWSAAACSGLRYSAVLPSPNPRAPVNNDARGRIRRLIGRVDKSELGGRVRRCLRVLSGWGSAARRCSASHSCTL